MEENFGVFRFGSGEGPATEPDQILEAMIFQIVAESMEEIRSLDMSDWVEVLRQLQQEQTQRACDRADKLTASAIRPSFAWMAAPN